MAEHFKRLQELKQKKLDEDKEIKIKNWGEDLGEILQNVYEEQSKWCLLFISREYKEKVWTIHEKRSALARAILGKGTY